MNAEQKDQQKIFSHMTRSTFLHVYDATDINKLKIFAGKYKRGEGASDTTSHYIDINSARPVLHDLSWGKAVDYIEFKGTAATGQKQKPESRVMKIKSNTDKVFFSFEKGAGRVIGEGAVKPDGNPTLSINVVFTKQQARELAYCILEYLVVAKIKEIQTNRFKNNDVSIINTSVLEEELGLFDTESPTAPKSKPQKQTPQITPAEALAGTMFLDGQKVPEEHISNWELYFETHNQIPNNYRTMIDWVYK